jgi:prepilin-type N-terminal cleavage/methylation domain-containing protein
MGRNLHNGRAKRGGFTLIEILIVIGIITVLITLTAAATIRFIATQQVKNTEATIDKVNGEFKHQWDEVIKAAKKEPPCLTAQTLANGDPYIARVIHIKLRLKQEFPMSYYEVFHQDPSLLPIQEYIDKLNQAGVFDVGTISPPPAQLPYPSQDENSACFVMALQRSRGGKGTNLDDLLGPAIQGSTSIQTITTPPPGSTTTSVVLKKALPIIIDAWEAPIVFYRWPTGNADVDGSGPSLSTVPAVRPEQRDTQDPEGKLQDLQTWWPQFHVQFEQICHSVSKVQNGQNGPYAYYMVPVIASGGPDRVLGIQPVSVDQPDQMQTAIQNNESDNLYSYRLRLGGRGD